MKTIITALVAFALGAFAVTQFNRLRSHPDGHEPAETSEAGHGGREAPELASVEHGAGGVVKVVFSTNATATIKALAIEPVTNLPVADETRAFGKVLDPAPLVALVNEQSTLVSALASSTRELERVRTLFAQDRNASARVVEAAEATAERDRLQLEGARSRLLLGWGNAIANRTDLPQFTALLARQAAVLVRLDLPLGEGPAAVRAVRLVLPGGDTVATNAATVLGPAPAADPQWSGRGVLCSIESTFSPAGTPVSAWVAGESPPSPHPYVPRSALLRHDGGTFVQVATGPLEFERRAIALDRPWGEGWLVGEGLKAGESIVTAGAQQILSAELKAGGEVE